MAPKTPPKPEKDKAERWLLTYADLITLLLIFFIVLYVMSIQDIVKFKAVSQSLVQALNGGGKTMMGEAPGPSMIEGTIGYEKKFSPEKKRPTDKVKKDQKDIAKQIQDIAKKAGIETSVSVKEEERGVVISIQDKVLFKSGEAVLNPEAHELLRKIGESIKPTEQFIRIEGHTDNQPISCFPFPTNWELSAARATNVVRLFAEEAAIEPERLSAVGYGQYRPVADNKTEEGRAKNRRVEIVIMNDLYAKSESGASQDVTPAAGLLVSKSTDGVPLPATQIAPEQPASADDKTPPQGSSFRDDFFEKELGGKH